MEYFNREVQKRRDEETNLWSEPGDPSHSERQDDRVLFGLLQARTKTPMGSTVWSILFTLNSDLRLNSNHVYHLSVQLFKSALGQHDNDVFLYIRQ